MPTLRQLNYLIAIADQLHFSRAARQVNVSQPTLSAQLSSLEEKLGNRLVERTTGKVALTPLGRQVAERARKIVLEVQEIKEMAADARSGLTGTLKLGVPPTLGPYLLPHVIPNLHIAYPDLRLYVKEGTPKSLQDELASGKLDIMLSQYPVPHRNLEMAPLFQEQLLVGAPPDHRLLHQSPLNREHLKGEKVLTLESGHHLHAQVRGLCDELGATLMYNYEGTSLDTLRHMVGMGLGISFFPALYVHSEIRNRKEIAILSFEDLYLKREIGIAWRAGTSMAHHYSELARQISKGLKPIAKEVQITLVRIDHESFWT